MKMAAGFLLIFCFGTMFLYSATAQDTYEQLSTGYKKGVDLSMEQLKSHASVHHHFRFFRTVDKSEMDSGFGVKFLYHHFYLKPTRCAKGTTDSNPQRCPFRNDRPLMDCAVCYKTSSDQIESSPKPYVHCMQKPRITEEVLTSRTDHCKKLAYNIGGPTLLAVSTGNGK